MLFEKATGFEWALTNTLRLGTIPVFVCDKIALPFGDVIEWDR